MGVTLSLHLHKGICRVSHSRTGCHRVSGSVWGCSRKTLSVHKIDVYCTEAAVTTLPRYSVYFVMTVFSPETSRFKLLALMSVTRKANCAGTLVEVILGYQSKNTIKATKFLLQPVTAVTVASLFAACCYCRPICGSWSPRFLFVSLSVFACHFVFLTLPLSFSR